RLDFVNTVDQALGASNLDPHFLELELTERLIIRDVSESASTMQKLRELGVQISVDDFGKGYSSLSYLQRLPIDILKLDRSFVEEFRTSESGSSPVQGILALAPNLGIPVPSRRI